MTTGPVDHRRPASPLIIGHRGAPGHRPEHTRASYELALAQGAEALEPDLVPSKDGVLVLRHENEISGTTDVAMRPEFAHLRTTKVIDGRRLTGWFTEDFTWAQLATLRAVERLPHLRPGSAAFDQRYPLMRFAELLSLVEERRRSRTLALIVELKRPAYFASVGLPLDQLLLREMSGHEPSAPSWDVLVVESFEKSVLRRLRRAGLPARYVYLLYAEGTAHDVRLERGGEAPSYAHELEGDNLSALRPGGGSSESSVGDEDLDGISVSKSIILTPAAPGHVDVVARAHRLGLQVYCWTFRPENAFLAPRYRTGPGHRFGDWRGELRALLESGVDGIFVDHPELAARERGGGSGL